VRALFVTMCVWLAMSPTSASTREELIGVWEAGDRAHQAIYPFVRISRADIEFSGNAKQWICKTPYVIVAEGTDETYRQDVRPFPSGVRPWTYYKLQLAHSKCTRASHLIFAFMRGEPNYIDFVEFQGSKWAGSGHFHRR
jgi:hypothetical protein